MVKKLPWSERKFEAPTPLSMVPLILERLRGTPARLEDRMRDVPASRLRKRVGDAWSIQETVGHLILAETLWGRRIDDYVNRNDTLRPVTESDQTRSYAEYNDAEIAGLLDAFREARLRLVRRIEELSDDDLAHSAIHPRLNQPMRFVDLMFFAAEHDDHHLAAITEKLRAAEG